MENRRNSKAPKLKSLDGVVSPINVPNFVGGRRFHRSPLSPIFDPYAFDSSDSPSPLMKYLCAGAPVLCATAPSSPVFATPLKVEEDVLVIDGIPVSKSNKSGRSRLRSTLTSLSLNSTPLSHPGGAVAKNSSFDKADICLNWEESGICRLGSKCQICKPFTSSSGSSSSTNGKKSYSFKQIIMSSSAAALSLPTTSSPIASSISTLEIKPNSSSIYDSKVPNPTLSCSNWSPLDDGIVVTLPLGLGERNKNPSKEDVKAHVQKVLYGTGSTKRLTVFLNICPD